MPLDELKILLVDDKDIIRDTVPEDLEGRLDEEHGLPSSVEAVPTISEVKDCLKEQTYHLLIVDLRLEGEGNGVELIDEILESQVLPLFIYSGYTGDLPPEHRKHGFIKVFEKSDDDQLHTMAEQIADWNASGALEFFSEGGLVGSILKRTLARTMWNNVSRYWEHFELDDPEYRQRIAIRLASNLIHDEYMSREEFTEDFGEVTVHHGEAYILDTPRNHLALGDVVEHEDDHHVVLTPSCDLIPRGGGDPKTDTVLMAGCESFTSLAEREPSVQTKFENIQKGENEGRSGASRYFGKMMRHAEMNDAGQYFFLPPFAHFDGGVIDFLDINTEDYRGEAREHLVNQRTITLNRELSAELGSRFVRYMLRLGQPTYDENILADAMAALGSDILEELED